MLRERQMVRRSEVFRSRSGFWRAPVQLVMRCRGVDLPVDVDSTSNGQI